VRKRELREKCQRLEAAVRERGLATEAELAEYRPKPRDKDDFTWVFWYGQLIRFTGRLEQRELVSAEADGLIIAALRADPREVKLSDPPHQVVQVYPKSFEALLNVHARDQLIGWLAARNAVCRQSVNGADVMALLERLAAELAYQQLLMVWTATAPGKIDYYGLPFAVEDDRPEIPESLRSISPWDIVRVHQAFLDVNATRLQALEKLIQPTREETGGGRPAWSVFIGSMALKWRVDPVRLMRDHALIQILATAKIAAMAGAGSELEDEVA
jgi:hypothetical protein